MFSWRKKVLLAIGKLVYDQEGLLTRLRIVEKNLAENKPSEFQKRIMRFGELRFSYGDKFKWRGRDGVWTLAFNEAAKSYNPVIPSRPNAVLTNGRYVEELGVDILGSEGVAASVLIKKFGPDYEVVEWANLG